ncbi:MAG: glutamate synthase subunit alpha, partial [Verrucomicrobia bacterium]
MNHSLPHHQSRTSLYDPAFEKDACGVGMVAKISGERSNEILRIGLRSICNLMHRGALDADARTGDGAGISTQIPYKLFRPVIEGWGKSLYSDTDLGVGVMYLPNDNDYALARAKAISEEVIEKRGLYLFGWREVPTNKQILGTKALLTLPHMEQVLVGRIEGMSDEDYERRLFLARNEIEDRVAADKIEGFYIPSFSHRMIVYKGLLVSSSLEKFYPDLSNPEYETALCVYHQRYSTNTFPTWPLAHPFRMLAHNGEINTVRGNRNWTQARESELNSDFWGSDIDLLKPIIQPGGSDSASLDNVLEILTMSGRSILHSMTMLVPPAWRGDKEITPELAAFYEYHTCLCEPWDGPAALVFTDGITIGACLDRNGLRPARYQITEDGIFSLGSEMGVDGLEQETILEKGRLAPGEMIAIDTATGVLLRDKTIKSQLASRQNYRKMLDEHCLAIPPFKADQLTAPSGDLDILDLTQRQISFGYTNEELDMIFKPMIKDGAEAVGSMGDDTPLAVLSIRPRLLYTYFNQLFAQVTNPPIDPIRERLVMSLFTTLGWRRNLLSETPEHAAQLTLDSPILFNEELEAVRKVGGEHKSSTLSTLWRASTAASGLAPAIRELCQAAEQSVDEGTRILILSDKGVDHDNLAIPALLAVGAVHHHLRRAGKRMRVSLVCETGEARDVHQMACLIGYGASAINPYLAIETIREMLEKGSVEIGFAAAQLNYKKALESGLLKIMSKMGISVIGSYRGAQIFEATGISSKLIEECFSGTPSQIEGIGLEEIARESLTRHELAYATAPIEGGKEATGPQLGDPGVYRIRRGGELHAVTPPVIKNFHSFVRTNKPEDYKAYVDAVMASTPHSLRNML